MEALSTPVKLPDSNASKVQFLASRQFPGLFPWSEHRSDQKVSTKVLLEWQSLAEDYAKELSESDSDLDRQYEAEWAKLPTKRRLSCALVHSETADEPSYQI